MGFIAALSGNAAKIEPAAGQELFSQVLADGEQVRTAYQLFRDSFVFTDLRIIFKDVQGITGSKVEWHSLPYKSISHYSIETAGTNDWDSELKIYVSGNPTPAITKKFNKKLSIYEVEAVLSKHVLG